MSFIIKKVAFNHCFCFDLVNIFALSKNENHFLAKTKIKKQLYGYKKDP
jgi:hypothetical protein